MSRHPDSQSSPHVSSFFSGVLIHTYISISLKPYSNLIPQSNPTSSSLVHPGNTTQRQQRSCETKKQEGRVNIKMPTAASTSEQHRRRRAKGERESSETRINKVRHLQLFVLVICQYRPPRVHFPSAILKNNKGKKDFHKQSYTYAWPSSEKRKKK